MATVAIHNIVTLALTKNVDLEDDTLKAALLDDITIDRATMAEYADVSAYELATANGYTVGGQAVTGGAVANNNTTYKSVFTCNSITWTASGGNLTASHCVIYDDDVTDDPIVMIIDFGGDVTAVDGQPLIVPTPEIDFNC